MKKLLTLPKEYSKSLLDKIDGVIIGIKDLSIGFNTYDDSNTISNTIDFFNNLRKEVFISLNKNMYNADLDYLRKILNIIKNKKISGILYYDIAVYNLSKDLNIPLYWNQEHLTTNYMTCNFWKKRGVTGVFASTDITVDEIIDIKNKTNMSVIVQIYGYTKMMASSRKLVSNYLKYVNCNDNFSNYKINDNINNKNYPIIEDNNGTITLSDKCINGIDYLDKLSSNGIDYILFDSINIDNIENVIDKYNNNEKFDEKEEYFLSKKTIFKVKK